MKNLPSRGDRRPATQDARKDETQSTQGDETQSTQGDETQSTQGDATLDTVFDLILAGNFDGAKASAHAAAEQARASGDADVASNAGLVYQTANAFDQAHEAMADKKYESAKSHAATAANQARSLLPTGAVDASDLQIAIDSAGKAWTIAKQAADQAAKDQQGGLDAPIVDQHQFDHWNNGAFCGVATLIMMLRANGSAQGSSNGDLNDLASQVYHSGQGTSGAQMASVLRKRGIEDSTYTTTGTRNKLIETLDKGQTVPLGVTHINGTITKLEGGSSKRYPYTRVGDQHSHRFGASGHWLLVTRYEGKAEAPTAFIVNDPDLGGEVRCTPAQLDAMGVGSGNYWMVHQ